MQRLVLNLTKCYVYHGSHDESEARQHASAPHAPRESVRQRKSADIQRRFVRSVRKAHGDGRHPRHCEYALRSLPKWQFLLQLISSITASRQRSYLWKNYVMTLWIKGISLISVNDILRADKACCVLVIIFHISICSTIRCIQPESKGPNVKVSPPSSPERPHFLGTNTH